jgi:wobble nucleotide-excising tRNase
MGKVQLWSSSARREPAMLEKIVQIKSIGRFRNYAANGDVTFRKLTLVYAENGRGKTTLCAILRSLQTGETEFIEERKTLAATEPALVHIRLNNANYQFVSNAWTLTYPDIAIFDPVFVHDNVYSGDYIEHENKKNLYRVIVGAYGVQLAKQIEELDGQIRDVNSDLRTKKDAVTRHMSAGTTLEDYLQWQPVSGLEDQIRLKTEKLSSRQRAADKSGEIQAKGIFAKVQIPNLPPEFAAVLAKQLTNIIADAETKVRQQIAQHQMGHQGEPWLSLALGRGR